MAIISTIDGDQDESVLTKKEGVVDDSREYTTWVEYYNASGVLVHRSAHVTIKQGVSAGAVAGSMG